MPRSRLIFLPALFLLSHCATKHQPIEFPPYFPSRADNSFNGKQVSELKEWETKAELIPLEKKRVWELYGQELKGLKPGTPRYQLVAENVQRLTPDVQDLEKEVQSIREKNKAYRDPAAGLEKVPTPFENPSLRRQYQEAYRMWNRDNNELALKKINEVVANAGLKEKASKGEWFRVLNLRFRVALDSADLGQAATAYKAMREIEDCAPDTATAGFLVALHTFATGDGPKALSLFNDQCDPDKSPANLLKRKYWQARFKENGELAADPKNYEELLRSKMPGYYVYLAKNRLGIKITLPTEEQGKDYLRDEMEVSREIHQLWSSAEERLLVDLRKDASVFLLRAAQILKADLKEANILPLLYTAHLFQAAGNHLEAMKIYAVLTTALQEDLPAVSAMDMSFLAEMFPRPFNSTVEWLGREWDTDPDFIYAIMRQESAFNPGAVSQVDARGLMQLMPSLARSLAAQWNYQGYYSDRLLFSAEENLKLATFHLYQLRALAPHTALMSAAYNAGLHRVNAWWRKYGTLPLDVFVELIPINETRNYVKLVLRNYIYYKAFRTGGTVDASLVPFKLPPFMGTPHITRMMRKAPKAAVAEAFRMWKDRRVADLSVVKKPAAPKSRKIAGRTRRT